MGGGWFEGEVTVGHSTYSMMWYNTPALSSYSRCVPVWANALIARKISQQVSAARDNDFRQPRHGIPALAGDLARRWPGKAGTPCNIGSRGFISESYSPGAGD